MRHRCGTYTITSCVSSGKQREMEQSIIKKNLPVGEHVQLYVSVSHDLRLLLLLPPLAVGCEQNTGMFC